MGACKSRRDSSKTAPEMPELIGITLSKDPSRELAALIRRSDETCLAHLKRLNAFIYQQKHRVLKKNKRAENKLVEWIRDSAKEQQKKLITAECTNFFMQLCLLELNDQEASCQLIKEFQSFLTSSLGIHDPLVSVKDEYGQTPLHFLALSNNHFALKELCKRLPSESAMTTNEEKQTPLHYAAKAGSLEVVEYLVNELDADLTAEDYCGRTPFLLAAEYGNEECTKSFLDMGCKIEEANIYNQNALFWIIHNFPETLAFTVLDEFENLNKFEERNILYKRLVSPKRKPTYYNESILGYIGRKKLENLCAHNVVVEFVRVQWKKTRYLFIGYCIFFGIIGLLINTFSLSGFENYTSFALLIIFVVTLILNCIVELFQVVELVRADIYLLFLQHRTMLPVKRARRSRRAHYKRDHQNCHLDDEHPVKKMLKFRWNKKPFSQFLFDEIDAKSHYLKKIDLLFYLAYFGILLSEYGGSQTYVLSNGGPLLFLIVASTLQFLWSLGILFESLGAYLEIISRQVAKIGGWIIAFIIFLVPLSTAFYKSFSGTFYQDGFNPTQNNCSSKPIVLNSQQLNQTTYTDSSGTTWQVSQIVYCSQYYVTVQYMDSYLDVLINLFRFAFGNSFDYTNMVKVSWWKTILLLIFYFLTVSITLLNILIAIITGSFVSDGKAAQKMITYCRIRSLSLLHYSLQLWKTKSKPREKTPKTDKVAAQP